MDPKEILHLLNNKSGPEEELSKKQASSDLSSEAARSYGLAYTFTARSKLLRYDWLRTFHLPSSIIWPEMFP